MKISTIHIVNLFDNFPANAFQKKIENLNYLCTRDFHNLNIIIIRQNRFGD